MSSVSAVPRAGSAVLVLDRRVSFSGTFDFDGDVVLAGKIEGEVRCKSLEIAERGSIDGDIAAEKVVVMGEVVGTIRANEIVLKTACTVSGQIYHKNLVLEDGCFFEGQSRRHAAPLLINLDAELPGRPAMA